MKKDINPELLAAFAREAGIPGEVEPNDALRNIGLLSEEGMINAGCLVLGEKSSRFLISATITCTLFQGESKVKILDQKVYDEDIASNYRNTLLYLQSHLNTEYIDYQSPADVEACVFSDRVEIVNPGGLDDNWFALTFCS